MQPDPEGNNTTVFNFIAPTAGFYPSTSYISRRVSEAPGSFVGSGYVAHLGLAPYVTTAERWGAYTAVAPGGLGVGGTPYMWFSGQYTGASGKWRTTIAKNGFTAPDQP